MLRTNFGQQHGRVGEDRFDLFPGDVVDVGLFAAELLEALALPRRHQEAEADGLEHEQLGQGALLGRRERVLDVVVVGRVRDGGQRLPQRSGALGARRTLKTVDPRLELLGDLDEQGVAQVLVKVAKGVEAGVSRRFGQAQAFAARLERLLRDRLKLFAELDLVDRDGGGTHAGGDECGRDGVGDVGWFHGELQDDGLGLSTVCMTASP
jgi:hypothetical protein